MVILGVEPHTRELMGPWLVIDHCAGDGLCCEPLDHDACPVGGTGKDDGVNPSAGEILRDSCLWDVGAELAV